MSKAKPFVKWVGGKTQLLAAIEKTLPADFALRQNATYIEPFVGGGAVLFWILQRYPNITNAVINDINPDLAKAYQTIKKNPINLVQSLKIIQAEYLILDEEHRKEYYLQKRERFNTKSLESVENTALFIFLNRTCFNGLYRVNSKGLFNVPFGRYANPRICDEQTIYADSELLQRVEILNGDFEKTLPFANGNTIFYFDPPYKPLSETSSFNSYSKEDFNDSEQIRLRNFCNKITDLGCNFILSNSDVKGKNPNDDFFDDLYNSFDIQRVFATRSVNANGDKRGRLTELMISNIWSQSEFELTSEELFFTKEYQDIFLSEIGDAKTDHYAKIKLKKDLCDTSRYKKDTFYHATGGFGEIGLGQGLYLGKDKIALNNFYNGEGEFGKIEVYKGHPTFLDLTSIKKFETFKKEAIETFGKDKYHNYLKKMTLLNNYDGIRYFDPTATGEEFVLYNTDKVELISKPQKKNNEFIL